ncbi:MAG: heavy-metal-associated domain-containing protein [Rhizobiales bacterium]|nr:heavy-metal-associated domain-containing protein [Hyphomicrobiales bacterium]
MLKLNVPDMSCGHCVGAITEAIKSIDPAAEVKTDLASKTVVVESLAPKDRIMTAVDGAGYPNTVAG